MEPVGRGFAMGRIFPDRQIHNPRHDLGSEKRDRQPEIVGERLEVLVPVVVMCLLCKEREVTVNDGELLCIALGGLQVFVDDHARLRAKSLCPFQTWPQKAQRHGAKAYEEGDSDPTPCVARLSQSQSTQE